MQKEGVTLKDLKHLIYFESLLEDANNELVRQAHEEGGVTLGFEISLPGTGRHRGQRDRRSQSHKAH